MKCLRNVLDETFKGGLYRFICIRKITYINQIPKYVAIIMLMLWIRIFFYPGYESILHPLKRAVKFS